MSEFFHIGIRVDEIISIGARDDSKFPTRYDLRGGKVINSTGDWKENIRLVNDKLSALESVRDDRAGLQYEIAALKSEIAQLTIAKDAAFNALESDAEILASWLTGPRNYLRADEREALQRCLDSTNTQPVSDPQTTAPIGVQEDV
jgi:hypothetical protein